jgi:hypothetical protein
MRNIIIATVGIASASAIQAKRSVAQATKKNLAQTKSTEGIPSYMEFYVTAENTADWDPSWFAQAKKDAKKNLSQTKYEGTTGSYYVTSELVYADDCNDCYESWYAQTKRGQPKKQLAQAKRSVRKSLAQTKIPDYAEMYVDGEVIYSEDWDDWDCEDCEDWEDWEDDNSGWVWDEEEQCWVWEECSDCWQDEWAQRGKLSQLKKLTQKKLLAQPKKMAELKKLAQ